MATALKRQRSESFDGDEVLLNVYEEESDVEGRSAGEESDVEGMSSSEESDLDRQLLDTDRELR